MASQPQPSIEHLAATERALREVTQALAQHLDERLVLDLAVQHAVLLLDAPHARIWLVDGSEFIVSAAGFGFLNIWSLGERLPVHSVSGLATRVEVLNLVDASQHPDWIDPVFFTQTGLHAYLGASLRRAGESLGVLEVMRHASRPFGPAEEDLLRVLASVVAVAVSNARLYRQAQEEIAERERQRLRRESLLRIARRFAAEMDPQRLLTELLVEAQRMVDGEGASVHRWDDERQMLVLFQTTWPPQVRDALELLRPGQGISGQSAEERSPVIANEYQKVSNALPAALAAGIQAAITIPLLHEGRFLGACGVGSFRPGRRFSREDVEMLELLSSVASAVLVGQERARLEGVLLASRTAAHHLNNQLSLTVGYGELLVNNPHLPLSVRGMALEALRGAREAAETLSRMQRIARLEEAPPPQGAYRDQSLLDLDRST